MLLQELPADLNSMVFSLAVLFIATVAYVLFMLSLPVQPHAHQRLALQLFTLFFVSAFVAYLLYCLRFFGFYSWSVVSNNLMYLLGNYFFYLAVRARYNQTNSTTLYLGLVVHLVLLSALMWYFSVVQDKVMVRLPIFLLSLCVPLLLSYITIRQCRSSGNTGDNILLLGCLSAMLVLPLLYPLFSFILTPDAQGQLYVTALVSLALETLCIGGVAMSYIYDLIDKLRHDAHTDKLTAAKNRRYFFRFAPQKIQEAQAQQQEVSLVMMDLDFFKQVNDNYGHQVGDELLTAFASLLLSRIGHNDLLARYGGEEFVLLLPGKNLAEATMFVNQIRSSLQQQPVLTQSMTTTEPFYISASFGLTLCQPGQQLEAMIRQADAALLRAKQAGRNRLELA
ncbi:GGDEF domain-containing protein [Rheinheimera sp.]|uniref:GGDEF domain-containing protein n=1 Tax=Rheinheimera sp. TaxID=1869214 RepID=UPI0027B9A502|nr:GGDEF domain-containing protein [Rheinheimera sp.]